VRHPLVQRIVRAYESREDAKADAGNRDPGGPKA
jgi:phosphate starvation-inducible protein PhoH